MRCAHCHEPLREGNGRLTCPRSGCPGRASAPTRRRKGRPLLVAAAGLAFVSFAGCHRDEPPAPRHGGEPSKQPPVGAPSDVDLGVIQPVGNLRAPEPNLPAPTEPTTPAADAGVPPGPAPIPPVGNLRPPEQPPVPKPKPKPHPVGNLRAPRE